MNAVENPEKAVSFPVIMKDTTTGKVVLFTEPCKGAILLSSTDSEAGTFIEMNNLRFKDYEPYQGEVTLWN